MIAAAHPSGEPAIRHLCAVLRQGDAGFATVLKSTQPRIPQHFAFPRAAFPKRAGVCRNHKGKIQEVLIFNITL